MLPTEKLPCRRSALDHLALLWLLFALVACIALAGSATADDDISLFSGARRQPPNIMLMFDTSGSMGNCVPGAWVDDDCTAFRNAVAETAVMTMLDTINPLDASTTEDTTDRVENARFGLMTFRWHGGYLQHEIGSGNTDDIISTVDNLTYPWATPLSGAQLDAGRYFAHQEGVWADTGMTAWGDFDGDPDDASDDESTSDITEDVFDLSCRDTHLVYITDGEGWDDEIEVSGFWSTIGDAVDDDGYTSGSLVGPQEEIEANVTVDCDGDCMQWQDDVARVMYETDFEPNLEGLQNVTTHVIGFVADYDSLERAADAGGGGYYTAGNASQLTTALVDVINVVFDPVASYSAAAVPSSRSQNGSAFFNAYFEPVSDTAPWAGHLEMYSIDVDGNILDKDDDPAVDPDTDLLIEPHNPHWDAGLALVSQSTRYIFTTVDDVRVALTDSSTVGNAQLGVASDAIRTELVSWVQGIDVKDVDGDTNVTEKRDIILGDIFHSTPAIVGAPTKALINEPNYAAFRAQDGVYNRKRMAYVGANDGMVHGFFAGDYVPPADPDPAYYATGDGSEYFGYVPNPLLDQLKFMPGNTDHSRYGVDGSPTVYEAWLASSVDDTTKEVTEWATVLITGYRKGGDGYLALDVTKPVSPPDANYPKLLWEFTDPGLGNTWSKPVITKVKVRNDTVDGDYCGTNTADDGKCVERWVAIFGAGYDAAGDPHSAAYQGTADGGWSTKSRGVYMVDISNGALLAKLEYVAGTTPMVNMVYSIPSDPAVIDINADGFADVVYIGDIGGNMWKWDISGAGIDSDMDGDVDSWKGTVFFQKPPVTIDSVARYHSFYVPPAVAYDRGKLVLAFGSGDRENVAEEGVLGNDGDNGRFYVMRDADPVDWYVAGSPPTYPTILTEADLDDVTSAKTDPNLYNTGYYMVGVDGEKFVTNPIIFAGWVVTTSYATATTSPDVCEAESGLSYLYAFRLRNGLEYWADEGTEPNRKKEIGSGLAATPHVSIANGSDKVYVKTSKGRVLTIEAPERSGRDTSIIYWKQND